MGKTIIVAGFGPGISAAVAEKFGAEGYAVALVARKAERLAVGAKALQAKGIKAASFVADLGDPQAVTAMVAKVRQELGPVGVLHWNAYGNGAGDLLKASPADLHAVLDVAVTGLLSAVQAALPDLRAAKGAVLVTNGGLALIDPQIDARAVTWGVSGLAVANAAKQKVVGILSEQLKPDGIYVGQVMVLGTIRGTPFDQGNANLEGSAVADKFWELYQARTTVYASAAGS